MNFQTSMDSKLYEFLCYAIASEFFLRIPLKNPTTGDTSKNKLTEKRFNQTHNSSDFHRLPSHFTKHSTINEYHH
jgi:hypothetical protein